MKNRIKEVRDLKRLTLDIVASRAGISTPYLHQLESGKRNINSKKLEAIAFALGCHPSDLFDYSEHDAGSLQLVRLKLANLKPEELARVDAFIDGITSK